MTRRTVDHQARFVRALEREFDQRLDRYQAAGMKQEDALYRAMADMLVLAGQALAKLRARGLYPFPPAEGGS